MKGIKNILLGLLLLVSTLSLSQGFTLGNRVLMGNQSQTITINYGYLYNWWAATHVDNIANTGWQLPSEAEWITLRDYLSVGDRLTNTSGGLMKETGFTYWDSPNTDATNTSNFNGRGAGSRTVDAFFGVLNLFASFWNSRDSFSNGGFAGLSYNDHNLNAGDIVTDKNQGYSIRLIKTTTTLLDGETSTYTGNDGKVYRTICIGTQEWLADNLVETLYRDLSSIPEVTVDATWIGLSTGARCSFDNDEANAL